MTSFSRLYLNPQKRGGRKLLSNPQAMHAAVMAAFPPGGGNEDGRVLWRLDAQHPQYTLYVVSPREPDLTHVVEQAGWATSPWETADYDRLLGRLTLGQEWGFRLRANPVKNARRAGERGKVLPHVTADQQTAWLLEKAPRHGFEIRHSALGAPAADVEKSVPEVAVSQRDDVRFGRADQHAGTRRAVTLRQAQFDGVLRVTNVELLRSAMTGGIGRGKAYGCGLLTLQRVAG